MFDNNTIGVEVEMTGITREKAAIIASGYFGTNEYYHTNDHYDSWVALDADGRRWHFSRDCSIEANDNEQCEMVTPILHYNDVTLLQGLLRMLRKAGARSNANYRCGVHIHIGVKYTRAKTLCNLVNIMASHEDMLAKVIGISANRSRFCKKANKNLLQNLANHKPGNIKDLENTWYNTIFPSSSANRRQHYNPTRYHMLNLHSVFTHGTVEFRMFEFAKPGNGRKNGIHAGMMKAWIQLCLAMFNKAKSSKDWVNYAPVASSKDNMLRWMNDMGMVGEEFATARELLTRNFSASQEIAA